MSIQSEAVVITSHNLDHLLATDLATHGGVILVDKPAGWTSFDVVAKMRGILRIKRIGHCGTLDPMATGLLIVCVGKATKLADTFQAEEKEYSGTIHFGATTPTDDAESPEEEIFPVGHLTDSIVRSGTESFIGQSMQTPPMYSARKVGGERLYKAARRGEVVDRPARPITVSTFEITRYDLPDVDFRVVCSKGTYVRTLARDLGTRSGSGAYLTALRRTRSGSFLVDQAVTVETMQSLRNSLPKEPS